MIQRKSLECSRKMCEFTIHPAAKWVKHVAWIHNSIRPIKKLLAITFVKVLLVSSSQNLRWILMSLNCVPFKARFFKTFSTF